MYIEARKIGSSKIGSIYGMKISIVLNFLFKTENFSFNSLVLFTKSHN